MNQSNPGSVLGSPRIPAPDSSMSVWVAVVAAALSLVLGAYWLSAVGVGIFFYYFVNFLQETGNDLPFENLILVMASMQWIIGPTLAYAGLSHHYKYYMYVPVEEYMELAVPGVIAFSLGLYASRARHRAGMVRRYAAATRQIVSRTPQLPFYLIGVGFVFSFLVDRFPLSLAFPAFILSNVKYVGLIYLMFSNQQSHKGGVLAVAFLLTLLSSIRGAMFHDLILWSILIGMYAAYIFRPTFSRKILIACLGLMFIFVLQSSKDLYRSKLSEEGDSGYLGKFASSVQERMDFAEVSRSGNLERVVIRVNQGWIVSRIMQTVPSRVPHANGETVATAIKASILPRFLFPDKPIAGGKENYEKYTGFLLQEGTSMGISLLGEAYINYGVRGAWFFMFVFGLVSSFIIKRFFLLAVKYPTIWLWFPLILLHFVKQETELLVQLNFLVKSILIVYLFVWANKHFLRLKL